MAASRTTRKTAAAKPTSPTPDEAPTPAPEPDNAAPVPDETPAVAEDAPQPPDVAPLEPPTVVEAPPAPAPVYATPTEVIPDAEHLSDVILDDETKKPPADVEGVFEPLTPYGSSLVCTVRLVERTFFGPHRNPVERLLQPKGAVVSESVAARIQERLVAQAAAADQPTTETEK